MSDQLDKYLSAYGNGFDFELDNDIILNWYPKRVMIHCSGSKRLLELGIGHGYTSHFFSQHFIDHVVVDGSKSVIEQFHRQYPDCKSTIVQAYFEDFEANGQFDVIVLGFILEHVENPLFLLNKYKKFLAPGGKCFVAVPNGESLHRRIGHFAGLLEDMMSLGTGDNELGHKRLYSVESLSREILNAGYCIVRKEGVFLKPLMTSQLKKLQLESGVIRAMCEVGIDYPELCCALLFEAKVLEK